MLLPVESREVLGDEIASVAGEILEITGAKIVDHGQSSLGKLFLQGKNEIGADETGAAGDEQVEEESGEGIGVAHALIGAID